MTPHDLDGVLVIDKPEGLTSHDVVAVARRALAQRGIGHTGTLDPMATGVLPLACGRATRLVRFLSGEDKEYDATVQFGVTTDTYDITGNVTSRSDRRPLPDAVVAAVADMLGDQQQTPPAYSAKRIGGRRAYDLARARTPVMLEPVPVRLAAAKILEATSEIVRLRLTCSAGFYVRSFAHDLGVRLTTGACLAALRRTRSGHFALADAVSITDLQGGQIEARAFPLARLLPDVEAVTVNVRGGERFRHGQALRPEDVVERRGDRQAGGGHAHLEWVRVLDTSDELLGLAKRESETGTLRPNIVLT